MVARKRPRPEPDPLDVEFVTSGSFLLDLVLGGGWAQGRIVNVVGDKSSGKTLLAIEACANFEPLCGVDRLHYAEAEAAFSEQYAQSIGFPIGLQLTPGILTVERFQESLTEWLKRLGNSNAPALYVLDSLDALSDEAEMEREIDKGSYGAQKAKKLSEMFRRGLAQDIEQHNATLFVISQIRDKIGVTFGETKTRSGGHALDFYASQIVWLAETGKVKQTVSGVERTVGLHVLARTKKNKVGMPFRDCDLTIRFGYGVDDEASMIDWLVKHKVMSSTEGSTVRADLGDMRKKRDRQGVNDLAHDLQEATKGRWDDIEAALAPPMRKYGD